MSKCIACVVLAVGGPGIPPVQPHRQLAGVYIVVSVKDRTRRVARIVGPDPAGRYTATDENGRTDELQVAEDGRVRVFDNVAQVLPDGDLDWSGNNTWRSFSGTYFSTSEKKVARVEGVSDGTIRLVDENRRSAVADVRPDGTFAVMGWPEGQLLPSGDVRWPDNTWTTTVPRIQVPG